MKQEQCTIDYDANLREAAKRWNAENLRPKKSPVEIAKEEERELIFNLSTLIYWLFPISSITLLFSNLQASEKIEQLVFRAISIPGCIVAILAFIQTIRIIVRLFRK